MSMALQVRVDELAQQLGALTARVRELEALATDPDAEPKRGPGRPRKTA
jgi:hypothetical protein